jgi:hypothetical protein
MKITKLGKCPGLLPNSDVLWKKIISYIQSKGWPLNGREISIALYHIFRDKRHRLYQHRQFLGTIADTCFDNDIDSFAEFDKIYTELIRKRITHLKRSKSRSKSRSQRGISN